VFNALYVQCSSATVILIEHQLYIVFSWPY